MIHATSVVDWNALGQVVLYSLIAGVGVPAIFALAVLGAARSTDPQRRGSSSSAVYAVVALVGAAVCVAAIAFGIVLMTQKG
ncbi:MAG: hypothetical protein WKF96_05005 [Solirubrobacteraceae bacterium]